MIKGQNVGYIRVSTADQNTERQLLGIELDRKFVDKCSGKSLDRPEFDKMLDYLREGDTLIVHSMDRLSRNVRDMSNTVKALTSKGVEIKFLTEKLTFTGDDSPMSNLILNIIVSVAQFEREINLERQREGIAIAQSKGLYTGRKHSLTGIQAQELRSRIQAGEKKATLAREYGISRETVYQYLKMA